MTADAGFIVVDDGGCGGVVGFYFTVRFVEADIAVVE